MYDKIDQLGKSVIQHGSQSNRIYLMSYNEDENDQAVFIAALDKLAAVKGYDKIVLKLPGRVSTAFIEAGYRQEAQIINFYPDGETCCFLSKFLTANRQENPNKNEQKKIVQAAINHSPGRLRPLSPELKLERLYEKQATAASEVYSRVFASYPFPITDPGYIRKTMLTHVDYYGVLQGDNLVALASAEKNHSLRNAEMTDFAILPEWRGKQLARHLLAYMEKDMHQQGYRTLFTIARAESLPMNFTFAGAGYNFGGFLVNNTQIAGKIESMNIWSKHLG